MMNCPRGLLRQHDKAFSWERFSVDWTIFEYFHVWEWAMWQGNNAENW
jgi:hypothetical protein